LDTRFTSLKIIYKKAKEKMNLFKKYYSLVESTALSRYYRSKGLEVPKKLSEYEQLQKYKDNPNIYISFRTIKRIGINPQTVYNTPNGVYSYPLSLIWKNFDHLDKRIKVPFAGQHSYIYVFKPKNISKGLFLSKYTEDDLKIDIQKIRNSKKFDNNKIDFLINISNEHAFVKTPGGKIWFITYGLNFKGDVYDDAFKTKQINLGINVNLWNRLLHKILGYDYIVDDNDQGIIFTSEPTQAVFFSSSLIDVIDIINNKAGRGFIVNTMAKVSSDAVYDYMHEIDDDWCLWSSGDWYEGTWLNGEWTKGTWHKGDWKKGHWYDGDWLDGTWHYGTWYRGTWHNGIWLGGTWHDGTWLGGYDKHGNFHPKSDSPDKWDIE
jgi:hypothetical protein